MHLAERLNHAAAEGRRRLPVMLEIKLSPEESKSGLDPESPELRELLERLPALDALELRGMMTVPPWSEDPETARPYFRRLRGLRDQFAAAYPRLHFSELSMGMSHDFAVAIEEGATEIRIGTGLFGPRPRGEPALPAGGIKLNLDLRTTDPLRLGSGQALDCARNDKTYGHAVVVSHIFPQRTRVNMGHPAKCKRIHWVRPTDR